MFEKVSQLAEQAATNVSRRQLLGQLGKGALLTAGALGTFLALPGAAIAGRRPKSECPEGTRKCKGKGGHCWQCYPDNERCPDFRCL